MEIPLAPVEQRGLPVPASNQFPHEMAREGDERFAVAMRLGDIRRQRSIMATWRTRQIRERRPLSRHDSCHIVGIHFVPVSEDRDLGL